MISSDTNRDDMAFVLKDYIMWIID